MDPPLFGEAPLTGDVRGSRDCGDERDEGGKGFLDKDTIVHMGIARLPGSAISTHLDNERTTRTGENARRGNTAFSRKIYQNTMRNKKSRPFQD